MLRQLVVALVVLGVLAPTLTAATAPRRAGRHQLVGKATRFAYEGDAWKGGKSPCLGRRVEATDNVIAHRTLPCNAKVRVTNVRTGRSTVATVGTRGPYGACLDEGWTRGPCEQWAVKRRASDPGVWRGVADLAPPVVEALHHRSFDRVVLEVLP